MNCFKSTASHENFLVIFSELNLDEEEEYQDTQDDEKQSEGLIFNLELFFYMYKMLFYKTVKKLSSRMATF